ncbi:hypothetical protein AWB78_03955 [Caballeronia calidae]|uniref:Uncharacterized protein n=1 Tax=Caballeronia calidae TaxID=1777139 RepID=A0A158CHR1_9BURK|nr:hypothetical protein [Caballeronia calidae]SAK81820.1 hypothetical protein AWB78_03955 [Caballeronia calidae]
MNPIFEAKTRDGEIARALNMAFHALCVHSGARIIMEGESVTLNFTREVAVIIRALQLLGSNPARRSRHQISINSICAKKISQGFRFGMVERF